MTPAEQVTLEAIVQANGLLPVAALRKDILRRMGLDGSRTMGLTRIIEQALQRLTKNQFITPVTGARPVPRKGIGKRQHPAPAVRAPKKVYNCVYYEATDAGRNALHV